MAALLDKMVKADVIALATPVYFYSMDGQLKTFIDRTVPRYTEISGKDFYFIPAAADTSKKNMTRTLEALRGFTEDCLDGAKEKGVIYGTGAWQKGEVKTPRRLKKPTGRAKLLARFLPSFPFPGADIVPAPGFFCFFRALRPPKQNNFKTINKIFP